MKPLMSSNVYEPAGRLLLVGSCFPEREPAAFQQLAGEADCVFTVCLEEIHFNMLVTKIAAVLGTNRVKSITMATVDRSPHCTQLHYLCHELERLAPVHVPIRSLVTAEGRLVEVPPSAIERSKALAQLAADHSS